MKPSFSVRIFRSRNNVNCRFAFALQIQRRKQLPHPALSQGPHLFGYTSGARVDRKLSTLWAAMGSPPPGAAREEKHPPAKAAKCWMLDIEGCIRLGIFPAGGRKGFQLSVVRRVLSAQQAVARLGTVPAKSAAAAAVWPCFQNANFPRLIFFPGPYSKRRHVGGCAWSSGCCLDVFHPLSFLTIFAALRVSVADPRRR